MLPKPNSYLGVILSSDISWSNHISAICSKARKLIGVLYRKFYHHSEPQTLLRLYQSLIRPHLEYACSIWDPHLKKDIEKLECVQKFGLKVCLKQWHCTYEDLTVQAGIPSLAVRRKLLKFCQLYSILNGHVYFHNFPTISRPSLFVNRIRSVHSSSHSLPFAHSNFYHN